MKTSSSARNSQRLLTILALAGILLLTGCKSKSTDQVTTPIIQEPLSDIFTAQEHMGVNYGPFHYSNQNSGSTIPLSQIQADLDIIARNFHFIRTYTVRQGMDKVVPEAAARGIEVALGVYCDPTSGIATKADIDIAVNMAKQYTTTVTAIVVGNETNLAGGNTNYVEDATVAGYMDYAKTQMTANGITGVTVSSCITGTGGLEGGSGISKPCPRILEKCRDLNAPGDKVIFMTIYPYYGQKNNNVNKPSDIAGNMQWSHDNGMVQAETTYGLDVIIGEIGWPSNGNDVNMENAANEGLNYSTTLKWVNGTNIYNKSYNTLWFAIFDEPWKTSEEFGVGPYWGIYGPDGATSPKFVIP